MINRRFLLAACGALAMTLASVPLSATAFQEPAPCLANNVTPSIEKEYVCLNCNNSGVFQGFVNFKIDFACNNANGPTTECGVWAKLSSYATGPTMTGPFTNQTINPAPQPILSRTYSCGYDGSVGCQYQTGPMTAGTYYQLTVAFGPLDANGAGGNGITSSLKVVFNGNPNQD